MAYVYKHDMYNIRSILNVIFTCLIIVCVFDPGDKILHMKIPLFCLSWILFFLIIMTKNTNMLLGMHSLAFVHIMLFIPLASIAYYNIFNGSDPYDGYQYFKSYLFISLVCILSATKIDLVPRLCWILTILSLVLIVISLITVNNPDIETAIYVFGVDYGTIGVSNRDYGGIAYKIFFYRTSLMIAIAISYFVYKTLTSDGHIRILYAIVSLINIYGMFLGGTRNNMMMSMLLPFLTLYWYSKQKKIVILIMSIFISIVILSYHNVVLDMFSLSDVSNEAKIGYLPDYYSIMFSNPRTLLFGQGLGSYTYWNALGGYASITELTLLELFRNYGLIGGFILLSILLFPLKDLSDKSKKNIHYLLLGYLSYLFMSLFNPLLFSSSGMLILAVIMAKKLSLKNKVINYQQGGI